MECDEVGWDKKRGQIKDGMLYKEKDEMHS